jgi:hypothetical protein
VVKINLLAEYAKRRFSTLFLTHRQAVYVMCRVGLANIQRRAMYRMRRPLASSSLLVHDPLERFGISNLVFKKAGVGNYVLLQQTADAAKSGHQTTTPPTSLQKFSVALRNTEFATGIGNVIDPIVPSFQCLIDLWLLYLPSALQCAAQY